MCAGLLVPAAGRLSAAADDLAAGVLASSHLITQHYHHIYQGPLKISNFLLFTSYILLDIHINNESV